MENTNPHSYENVKVFASDGYTAASDASYKNLKWTDGGKNDGKYKQHATRNIIFILNRKVSLSSI